MEIYLPTDANLPHSADQLYDIRPFGNVSLLHFTDCHAQLLPIYYREPSINLGVGRAEGKVPHLVGVPLLSDNIQAGSREAYAFSHLDFCAAARSLRQGRWFRASGQSGQAHESKPPTCLAVRRRRQLAGICDVPLDSRTGHGRSGS